MCTPDQSACSSCIAAPSASEDTFSHLYDYIVQVLLFHSRRTAEEREQSRKPSKLHATSTALTVPLADV
jgi:hypothetical protein